jgi:hypothetical protein
VHRGKADIALAQTFFKPLNPRRFCTCSDCCITHFLLPFSFDGYRWLPGKELILPDGREIDLSKYNEGEDTEMRDEKKD